MHKQVTILLCLLSMLACQSGAAEPLTNTKRAKQHADCEEWQSAIEIYTKELAAHPKDAECLAGRGLAYARQGNLQQAFADFSYAIKCDPNCTEAYSNRSRVYEWLGLIGPARKDAEQALARVSTVTQDLDSIMRQAGLLNCVGKKIEAETEYNHALLLCSKDADLSALLDAACAHYQLEHLKDSLNCLTQAHNLSPKNAYIYYLRACVYKSLYQWTLATDELNQHLALIPNNPLALNLRGDCAAAQENYKTAIAFYTAATKIAPSFASAFRSRGFIYRILGEYPKAIEDFTTVIDLDSTDFFSFAERAYARCQLKEWALALKDAQQANSLNPNYAPVYRYKALAQGKLGFFTEAIDALNKYISLEPRNPAGYYDRGICYRAHKEYKNAIADFTEAIKLDPNDAMTFCARASVLVSDRQYESAIADCNQSLKLNANCTNSLLSRGIAYARSGQSKLALQDLDEAIKQIPNFQEAYYERGLVHKLLGNEKLYQSDMNKAKALSSSKTE